MIKPAEAFLTKTLREKPWGKNVTRILAASLAAVDPAAAVRTNSSERREYFSCRLDRKSTWMILRMYTSWQSVKPAFPWL